ncbi:hypothetical protein [Streptomyces sp. NBC_00158]|uniref:hypothetical protein n=1 Tax=Streptomyces sp. NBC_00158 TaxID=2903627 RepID=UPI00325638C0
MKDLAFDSLASAINVVINAGRAGLDILENLGEGLSPVAEALAEVTGEAEDAMHDYNRLCAECAWHPGQQRVVLPGYGTSIRTFVNAER